MLSHFHRQKTFSAVGQQALVYHALGREQDSNASLTQLIKRDQQSMAYQIAEFYAYRGESDLALQVLNRAYQQPDSGLRSVEIDLLLKSLRQDPQMPTC